MKRVLSVTLAAMAFGLAPLAAHSAHDPVVTACVNAFAAESFPGQTVTIRLDMGSQYMVPLMLRSRVTEMKLVASEKDSGKTLASAVCTARNGVVKVVPSAVGSMIAAR